VAQSDESGGRATTWSEPSTISDGRRVVRALPDMGCVLRPAEPAPNAKRTSVSAGQSLCGAPRRNRTGDPSLPWNHQEPLCGPPFPQVTADPRGRSYRFCFGEVMRSLSGYALIGPEANQTPHQRSHCPGGRDARRGQERATAASSRDPGCDAPAFVCEGGGSPHRGRHRCRTCAADSPDRASRPNRTRHHRPGIPGLRGTFCSPSSGRSSAPPPALVVLLRRQPPPIRRDGLGPHGVQFRHAPPALLVAIAGLPRRRPDQPDLRSMQPLGRVELASQVTVALAQGRRAQRRVSGQPGQVTKLIGVDPIPEVAHASHGLRPLGPVLTAMGFRRACRRSRFRAAGTLWSAGPDFGCSDCGWSPPSSSEARPRG